mmetsp:Transcript_20717/g.47820  ORF Transcript_20717/g.47820 Transcript_20717/m.47820 type:complete len:318 (-) Transcript_20717:305-1258(-)
MTPGAKHDADQLLPQPDATVGMKKELSIMQMHATSCGMPSIEAGRSRGDIGMSMGMPSGQGEQWNPSSATQQQAQQQLFALQQGGMPPQGSAHGGWIGGGGFVGAGGIHPSAYFNQTQIGAMVSGMMGGMPHMQGGMNQIPGMGGFAPVGASGAFAPPQGLNKRPAGFDQGQGAGAGDAKGRKAPKRSLAATIERMEKHKILERKRRERTKELVAELMGLVPGTECLGDSPTMNAVLEEAIQYLKDSQWESEQRIKHPCTCGAPGVGSNPMPARPCDEADRSSSGTGGGVSNASNTRIEGDTQLEDGGGAHVHMQQF